MQCDCTTRRGTRCSMTARGLYRVLVGRGDQKWLLCGRHRTLLGAKYPLELVRLAPAPAPPTPCEGGHRNDAVGSCRFAASGIYKTPDGPKKLCGIHAAWFRRNKVAA